MPTRRASLVVYKLKTTPRGLEEDTSEGYPRTIPFQYNPETMERTVRGPSGGSGGDGAEGEVLRVAGPPEVTVKLKAELLAWDPSLIGAARASADTHGVRHQIAALESLMYPRNKEIDRQRALAETGIVEVLPAESLMVVLVWSKDHVVPVKIQGLTVVEDRFDDVLRPVHATVELTLQLLSVNDLGFEHPGSPLAQRYHQEIEDLAAEGTGDGLEQFADAVARVRSNLR